MSQDLKIDTNPKFSHPVIAQTMDITSDVVLDQNKKPVFKPAPQISSIAADGLIEADLPFDLVGAAN